MLKKFFIFNCHFAFCILIFAFIQIFLVFFIPKEAFASEPNNKFGIHLAQPHLEDLKKAADLVNSSGGDWGYVTLVMQENDRNRQKWQEIFDLLRKHHLIPIIRLATAPSGEDWRRPQVSDVSSWVNFLDSLNWVVKNRYIVLFNEPNHGNEWGGAVDPKNYAEVAFAFAKALKEKNQDFFVMLAGFDASAPHLPPNFYDEEIFLKEMLTAARELTHNDNSQKNSNQKKSRGNLDISSNVPKINRLHIFSSNLKLMTKKNILKIRSYVNNKKLLAPFKGEKLGVMIAAAKKPADKLIQRAEVIRKSAFFDFWESFFIKNILAQEKKDSLFDYIDGWASHSYPNPSFSGSPYDFGRGTVRTYQWELNLLRQLGVEKELPVFITETGWERKKLTEEQVAQNFKIAFEQIWLPDEKVKAVTPFVLDYQMEPFLGFSWKHQGDDGFYQQYYFVQLILKTKGEPEQIEKGEIIFDLPKELVAKSSYDFFLILKNEGQAIWEKDDGYDLRINCLKKDNCQNFDYLFEDIKNIKPFEEKNLRFFLKTKNSTANSPLFLNFVLIKNEKEILSGKNWQLKIIPPPKLTFEVVTFPRIRVQNGDDFELQIFDKNENLVFKKKMVKVENKKGVIAEVDNVVFGEKYRVVILKPYYLPRQTFVRFQKGENKISFKTMLPLDFNLDGKFDWLDLKAFFAVLAGKILPN
jgi:hypothetical protein